MPEGGLAKLCFARRAGRVGDGCEPECDRTVRGVGGGYRFAGNVSRTTLLDVIQLFETLESELDVPNARSRAGSPVVAELQSITREIDDLTKAVLDTITLETALKGTRRRAEAAAGARKP